MDAIAQRVEASKNMQALGQSMGNVVNVMGLAIEAMDVEKVRGHAHFKYKNHHSSLRILGDSLYIHPFCCPDASNLHDRLRRASSPQPWTISKSSSSRSTYNLQ